LYLYLIDPRVRKISFETRPPVAVVSVVELSTFDMSLAPLVSPSPIFMTDTVTERFCRISGNAVQLVDCLLRDSDTS